MYLTVTELAILTATRLTGHDRAEMLLTLRQIRQWPTAKVSL
jgi:hypothetical protein